MLRALIFCVASAVLLAARAAAAQESLAPDIVLVNGKIVTVDPRLSIREGLAVKGNRIVALGTSATIAKLAGRATRVIDLEGHTVIPGLIDSHIHAIRAALSFTAEVNWIGARSLTEALGRIREAAGRRPPRPFRSSP